MKPSGNPVHDNMVALMSSLTDATEWTEKRIALFDANDKFVAMIPSNTHYGAINSLCRKFNLHHIIVEVTVNYDAN